MAVDLVKAGMAETMKGGIAPSMVADQVLQAIRDERVYILTEGDDSVDGGKMLDMRLKETREL